MLLHRRLFVAQAGRATLGVLVVAATGCSRGAAAPGAEQASPRPSPTALAPVDWRRVNLGLVSAYILVRGDEAAIVDTGWRGSSAALQAGLEDAGLSWASVAHVILTHSHADHVGSLPGVLDRATKATAYAGEADVAAIQAPRPVTPLADGERVFGLQVIATPGHTPGHIALLDRETELLIAGDALRGAPGGGAAPPVAQYTEDMDAATQSIRKLAGYRFQSAVFGHGEPITDDASDAVETLVEQL